MRGPDIRTSLYIKSTPRSRLKTPALLTEAGARQTARPCADWRVRAPGANRATRGYSRLRLRYSAAATGPNVKSNTGHRKPGYSLRRVGEARSAVTRRSTETHSAQFAMLIAPYAG